MIAKIINVVKMLPNLLYYFIFSNDGMILHTSFEPPIDIPKVGDNFTSISHSFDEVLKSCAFPHEITHTQIFLTTHYYFHITRVDERTLLGLIFPTPKDPAEILKEMNKLETEIRKIIEAEKEATPNP